MSVTLLERKLPSHDMPDMPEGFKEETRGFMTSERRCSLASVTDVRFKRRGEHGVRFSPITSLCLPTNSLTTKKMFISNMHRIKFPPLLTTRPNPQRHQTVLSLIRLR